MTPNVLEFFHEVARTAQTDYLFGFVQHCLSNSNTKTNNFRFVTPLFRHGLQPVESPGSRAAEDMRQHFAMVSPADRYRLYLLKAKGWGVPRCRESVTCIRRFLYLERRSLNIREGGYDLGLGKVWSPSQQCFWMSRDVPPFLCGERCVTSQRDKENWHVSVFWLDNTVIQGTKNKGFRRNATPH